MSLTKGTKEQMGLSLAEHAESAEEREEGCWGRASSPSEPHSLPGSPGGLALPKNSWREMEGIGILDRMNRIIRMRGFRMEFTEGTELREDRRRIVPAVAMRVNLRCSGRL